MEVVPTLLRSAPHSARSGDGTRRRRVRRSALVWALVAGAFYLGFIALTLVRGGK
jgi:hypothetical protein